MAAAEARFDIWEFRIAGVTLVDRKAVEAAVYPFLGRAKTVADIDAANKAIINVYKQAGYPPSLFYITIPEQDVDDGVVDLVVVEGRISRLNISDSDFFSISNIKDLVPSVKRGSTPLVSELNKELGSLNSMSGDLSLTPVLRPGKTPGTLEVDLMVNDKLPLHGNIEVNNHASEGTTSSRLAASVRYDNLWQRFHSFNLQIQTTPEDTQEVRVYAATYVLPVNNQKDRLVFYTVKSDTDILTSLGDFTVLGNGTFYGARYLNPLESNPGKSQSVSFGMDYKKFSESIALAGAGSGADAEAMSQGIDYMIASLSYNQNRLSAGSRQNLSLGIVMGSPIGPNDTTEFYNKRSSGDRERGADPNFLYLEGNFLRVDQLATSWELHHRIKFQLTNDLLISNEQFGIGGANSVRGYYESQTLGDLGGFLNVELHWLPQNMTSWKFSRDFRWDLYPFVDYGAVEVIEPSAGQSASTELGSYGVGFSVQYRRELVFKSDIAWPRESIGETDDNESKVHVSLEYKF